MVIGRNAKMLLCLVAIAIVLMFSEMNAATLFAATVGVGLIMLGLASYYRPASAAGLMIAAAASAISNNPGSLTAVPSLLNAVFGLLIPIYVLAWVSLSSGSEELIELRLRSKANSFTILFMIACVLSVPVAAVLLGLISPRFSMAMSVLTEIAIILAVATAGIILLTAQRPRTGPGVESDAGTNPE